MRPRGGGACSKNALKVLEAPDLRDDFYLNLLDWSQQNILAVALGDKIYLWNAATSEARAQCSLPAAPPCLRRAPAPAAPPSYARCASPVHGRWRCWRRRRRANW